MKKLKFFFAIFLLIFLYACDDTNNQKAGKDTPFIGGQSGLSVQFLDDAPPSEVFDRGQFPFNIELKLLNQGEAEVKKENVLVKISGLNPSDFGKTESFFIKNSIDEDILAMYKDFEGNLIKPNDVIVTFPNLNFKDTLTGNFKTKIRADVCYNYNTQAITTGCIKPDPVRENPNDICTVKEAKTIYNSAAPIQIESFEELPSGTDKVRYIFKIKHVGSGKVYSPNSKCPETRESLNKLYFKLWFPGEASIDFTCAGLEGGQAKEGYVILRDGEATIRCTQNQVSNIVFSQRMQIKLDYDYMESTDKELLVKKSD
ncbi:MAG: hypothetical protein QXR96_00455 [Candidatus Woesearchaeota archaeon]